MFIDSILTTEERYLLQSMDRRDKEQAVDVLGDIIMSLPVGSELFNTAASLSEKLRNGKIDYGYEMRGGIPDDSEQGIESIE